MPTSTSKIGGAARDSRERAGLHATVRGRVQGVGYRHFTRQEARRLNLSGWVRNERDGTVTVVAEGAPEDLEALLAALREGPAGARVEDVEARRQAPAGEAEGFHVKR